MSLLCVSLPKTSTSRQKEPGWWVLWRERSVRRVRRTKCRCIVRLSDIWERLIDGFTWLLLVVWIEQSFCSVAFKITTFLLLWQMLTYMRIRYIHTLGYVGYLRVRRDWERCKSDYIFLWLVSLTACTQILPGSWGHWRTWLSLSTLLGLPKPAHGPGPHVSPWDLSALALARPQQGQSPAPHSSALPGHMSRWNRTIHRPMSQPGLSLSPQRCLMPGTRAAPMPPGCPAPGC